MKNFIFFSNFILILTLMLFFSGKPSRYDISAREIISNMLDTIKKIKTQRFDLKSTERINEKFSFAESRIKINESPKKIYFKSPKKGIEALWLEGENDGNLLVHTQSVSFMSFDLNPYGSIIRKDQHHTIFDLGFQRIGITIANTIIAAPKDFNKHFKYGGIITWNNKECYQMIIEYPEYKYIEYITKKDETVNSIAQKLNTSDYKIRYKNNLSSYFGAIKEGKKLQIPIPYSNKAIFYIEKKTMLPIVIKIYDDEGLYELYEYYNIIINKPFASDEFSKNYKDYQF